MISEQPVSFHLSLNVSDIEHSVAFFAKVFGQQPSKHRSDYAKFDLSNPPLTLSLEPSAVSVRGVLNHVGVKLKSAEELVALQRRLEMAGLKSQREEGVECCYSRQTKFWLHDPDQTLWEFYVLQEDLDHRGAGQSHETIHHKSNGAVMPDIGCSTNNSNETASPNVITHRLGNPWNLAQNVQPESVDHIKLQGTFNGEQTNDSIQQFLTDVYNSLKPGGDVLIHCLTSDRQLNQRPSLSGPASVVKVVPCLNSLIQTLETLNFQSIEFTKYGSRPCFTIAEAELRETILIAKKPAESVSNSVFAMYTGPAVELVIEDGHRLVRGRQTELPRHLVEQLKQSSLGTSIIILETNSSPVSCTG